VILDAATPTRLFGAFPEGVVPERVGLVDAIEATKEFLSAS
jgi:ATP-dependent DNA helicase DinG